MTPEWPPAFPADVVREGFGRLSAFTIALEAWRRGLSVTFLDGSMRRYAITDEEDGRTVRFVHSRPHMSRRSAVRIANNKYATNQHLREARLPAPRSALIRASDADLDHVHRLANELGYPVVLKPTTGSKGDGVFSGIGSSEELERYLAHLVDDLGAQRIVLEEHVQGQDYRVLVYGDAVVGVCLRQPASVAGDGERTVGELITAKNAERRKNPFLSNGLIRRDREVDDFLDRQGLQMNSVPVAGTLVRLRAKANASAGGDVVGVTDEFPQHIKDAAVAAVASVPGLFCAGVDVLYDDQSSGEGFHILELNAHPQIGVNMYPTHGRGVDAPRVVIDQCFPDTARNSAHGDRQLVYAIEETISPLRLGVADKVRLAPVPNHRFPCRRVYRLTGGEDVTRREYTRLLRRARRSGVSGHLQTDGEGDELLAAGRDIETVSAFVAEVCRRLGREQLESADWGGPLRVGFRISPAAAVGTSKNR